MQLSPHVHLAILLDVAPMNAAAVILNCHGIILPLAASHSIPAAAYDEGRRTIDDAF
jgi:hypothetical protein